jgi:hypothetical protein
LIGIPLPSCKGIGCHPLWRSKRHLKFEAVSIREFKARLEVEAGLFVDG